MGKEQCSRISRQGQKKPNFKSRGIGITGRSSPGRVVSLIKSKLDATNLATFRSSVFGPYLDFPDALNFEGPVIHLLLSSLTSQPSEGTLTFNVKGVEATFGHCEFVAIAGLPFVHLQPIIPSSSCSRAFVGLHGKVETQQIEDRFEQICDMHRGGGQEALMLGCCLFLYGVLIGPGFSAHSIDNQYLKLFDNFDTFNSFAWGRVAYDYLLRRFHSSKAVMDRQIIDQKNIKLDVHGLALALQVWAYEVFPEIGSMRNHSKLMGVCSGPRILGWSCRRRSKYQEFEYLVNALSPLRKVPFKFTEEEVKKIALNFPLGRPSTYASPELFDRAAGVVESLAVRAKRKLQFGVCNTGGAEPPVDDICKKFKGIGNVRGLETLVIPSSSTELTYVSPSSSEDGNIDSEPGTENLPCDGNGKDKSPVLLCGAKHFDEEAGASGLPTLVPLSLSPAAFFNTTTRTIEFPYVVLSPRIGSIADIDLCHVQEPLSYVREEPAFDSEWIDEAYGRGKKQEEQILGGEVSDETASQSITSSMSRDPGDIATYINRGLDGSTSPTEVKSGCSSEQVQGLNNTSEPHPPLPGKKPLIRYSPMKRYPRALRKGFKEWYYEAKRAVRDDGKHPSNLKFPIRLKMTDIMSLSSIRMIYKPHTMLGDEQCDLLLNLLLLKANTKPEKFRSGWTCVENLFWARCSKSTFDSATPVGLNYILGRHPLQGPLAWNQALDVYGIAHVLGNHWVAYHIDMLAEKIFVYDSLVAHSPWETVRAAFLPMSTFIPLWLDIASDLDTTFLKRSNTDPWEVVKGSENLVLQSGLNDCGILSVKYVEAMASGTPLAWIDPDKCWKLRLDYSAQLFNSGISTMPLVEALDL